MKSSTKKDEAERQLLAAWQEPEWDTLLAEQGSDWQALARSSGAMVRERKVKGAWVLLRLVLAYAVCDWSLRMVGMWATIQGIAKLSDVALLYRFRQCQRWLGQILVDVLQRRNAYLSQQAGVRVRLIDATVISQPGSQGTDWRVHASFDLGQMGLDGLEITDAHGGESLTRFPARADEIVIADRAYAVARGLGSLLSSTARLVVRIGWHNLPLKTDLGQRLDLIHWLTTLKTTAERRVHLSTPQGDFTVRLVAAPLPPDQAQAARERVSQAARKKGKKVNPNTYLAAGFVLLVTNLPAELWEVSRVLWLYRLRWQIELHFKRLKGLLHLDHLRAIDPRLVQTYLLGKLLAALLIDQLVQASQERQPLWFASPQRPISLWRLHDLFWLGLRHLIVGRISLPRILAALGNLQRYLCDSPRKRCQQLAWARAIFRQMSGV
jgi:hypothetical protein